jgi:hypothetical protein
MRCIICDVDLNENATLCPLCGVDAQDVPPHIEGIVFQDYPAYPGNDGTACGISRQE